MTRTFSKADWNAAGQAWAAADLGPEWLDVRRHAALNGLLYPPNGSPWDSWSDDQPSQVAIVTRAIRDTPDLLFRCIAGSQSWGDAIGRLIAARDEWARDQRRRDANDERSWAAEKARDRMESATFIARIGAGSASTSRAPTSAQEGARR